MKFNEENTTVKKDLKYRKLRDELRCFYKNRADALADDFYSLCQKKFELIYDEDASGFSMKSALYRLIADNVSPVLFENNPFYYETGTLRAKCSGVHDTEGAFHAGTLLYQKRKQRFCEYDPAAYARFTAQKKKKLYLVCGPYCDVTYHFPMYMRTVFQKGLSGVYAELRDRLKNAENDEQIEFFQCAIAGLEAVRLIQEKFAKEAKKRAEAESSPALRKHWDRIRNAAERVPWNAPTTLYEALSTYALMRNCVGTLDAVSIESFGRMDVDLYPFYKRDIERGVLTYGDAYDLICQFLITWDLHFDHDEIDSGFWINDTLTVGGCDADGNPVYNEITEMLLKAHHAENVITPKIMCRFSKDSPKPYINTITQCFLDGAPTINLTNDDLIISAQIKNGRSVVDARDYLVVGCWEINTCDKEKADVGTYFHLLKPLEYAIHQSKEIIEGTGLDLSLLDGTEDFEGVYKIALDNIRIVIEERASIIRGRCVWKDVSPMPLYSAFIHSCIDKGKDFTDGGATYNDDQILCFGFPDLVDSLTVIKKLCFEEKKYSLSELVAAVRNNWEGAEDIRAEAIRCPSFGDGTAETAEFAKQVHDDIYAIIQSVPYSYMRDCLGGKLTMGHLNYNESVLWGLETLATPNGRKHGEHIAQGLTPTGYCHAAPTSVISGAAPFDEAQLSAGSVITVMLPTKKMDLDIMDAMVRAAARCKVGSLQFNCVSKKDLLEAQKYPEKHNNLIVRVCGFSAKFTALSKIWQDDIISKCVYE